jgi:cupin fold WbuC family metalloprotein
MILINRQLLDRTTQKAKESPRLRMNHNFHKLPEDPINRLLNAMEPGTYLRPHRHKNPDKNEVILLLRGKAALFLFDDNGNITEQVILDPLNGNYGIELTCDMWHTLLILESGTVVYEIKDGPYAPLSNDNMASWSPEAGDLKGIEQFISKLRTNINE